MDAFATLGLPRLAGLPDADITSAYFAASKAANVDPGLLNAAHELLKAPEKRIAHLIELTGPADAKQWRTVQLSDDLMQLFMAIGRLRPAAEALIEKRARAQSALVRATTERPVLLAVEEATRIAAALSEAHEALLKSLPSLDEAVTSGRPDVWRALVEAQTKFAYLAKWQAQVRELLARLSM